MTQDSGTIDPQENEPVTTNQDQLVPDNTVSDANLVNEQPVVTHEQYVQALALKIFDETEPLHELPEESRIILSLSALVYDQPYKTGKKKPIKAFRKGLYSRLGENPAPEIDAEIVPVLLYQCGKIKRKDIINKMDLSTTQQRSVLTLAAILRLAIGLDSSNTQSTIIEHIKAGRQVVWIAVDGPQAMRDSAAAQHSARLWEKIGYPKIMVAETRQVLGLFTPQFSMSDKVGIEPADTMAEAGRKVFRFHFAAMLNNEAGTRSGEDIEHLHDMRVATRRMRAAFDIFGDAFEKKTLKSYLRGLRATGRALGKVRDLDVFIEKAQLYLNNLPEEQRSELDPLLIEWHSQRDRARVEMLAFLDSEEYQTFKARFGAFVMTPGAGALPVPKNLVVPELVCEVVPALIYERLAAVRAFDKIIPHAAVEQLHALRIEFKKIRYTVEYFKEVLGPEGGSIIDEFKTIQDHLGDLNDAQVAGLMLQEYLDDHAASSSEEELTPRPDLAGLVKYKSYREVELSRLIATFPEVWVNFNRPEFRQKLAMAVSVL